MQLIRPIDAELVGSPAKIIVAGKCGEAVQVQIQGTPIEFICGPATEGTPLSGSEEQIPEPRQQGPGRTAFAIDNLGALLEQLPDADDIDVHAGPVVVTVPHGRSITLDDLGGHIAIARREHRTMRLDLGSKRD